MTNIVRQRILSLRSKTYERDPFMPHSAPVRFTDEAQRRAGLDAALLQFEMLAVLAERVGMSFDELRAEGLKRVQAGEAVLSADTGQ